MGVGREASRELAVGSQRMCMLEKYQVYTGVQWDIICLLDSTDDCIIRSERIKLRDAVDREIFYGNCKVNRCQLLLLLLLLGVEAGTTAVRVE